MLSGDDLAILLFFLSLAFAFGLEAAKAETVGRRIAFAILSVVCVFTGVFWLQIKKIWPPFTEIATSVSTNPLAWFIVLMFILAVFAFHRPGKRTTKPTEPSVSFIGAVPIATSGPPDQPPASKIFIDVSPAYLIDFYKNRTSIQGDALAAAYLGKWIIVTAKVRDVYASSEDIVLLCDADDRSISARFSKDTEKAAIIAHGTTVKIRGQIQEIDSLRVRLRECAFENGES